MNLFHYLRLAWKALWYPETMDCDMCAGMGIVNDRRRGEKCPRCGGDGVIK